MPPKNKPDSTKITLLDDIWGKAKDLAKKAPGVFDDTMEKTKMEYSSLMVKNDFLKNARKEYPNLLKSFLKKAEDLSTRKERLEKAEYYNTILTTNLDLDHSFVSNKTDSAKLQDLYDKKLESTKYRLGQILDKWKEEKL